MKNSEILRTDAIALRISPFSNTSHIVTWLTQHGARIATSIRGACRNKSRFLGQYDYFYNCELLFYAHASASGIHTAREVCPIEMRPYLRTNWRAAMCASWFASLAMRAVRDGDSPPVYRLLENTLGLLDSPSRPTPAIFTRYELKLLDILGTAPNMSAPPCGCRLTDNVRFCIPEGRIVCPRHEPALFAAPGIFISGRTAQLCEAVIQGSDPGAERVRGEDTARLLRCLGLFIHYHIDGIEIKGRSTAVSAVAFSPPTAPAQR